MTASRRRRWLYLVGLLLAASTLLSACASDAELDTLDPAGPNARRLDNLINPVFGIAGFVLLFVGAATIYCMYRFRASRYPDGDFPEQLHGNTKLEIGWTVVPALILAGVAVFTVAELQNLNDFSEEDTLDVVVVGNQWWWEYRYYLDGFDPDTDYDPAIDPSSEPVRNREGMTAKEPDLITATQLVIPAGREVHLSITSRDVVHSFWIPRLNGKRDAAPGLVTPWKIEADEPGVYFGQCTEYCGLSHSRMRMQVVALTPEEFDAWLQEAMQPRKAPTAAAQAWLEQQIKLEAGEEIPEDELLPAPDSTPAERGMVAFRQQCSRCHEVNGINDTIYKGAEQVSGAAPNLSLFANRTTYAGGIFNLYNADGTLNRPQLEAWLRNPPAEKAMAPNNEDSTQSRGMPNLNLSEAQIDDLIEFLITLGPKPSDAVIQATEVE
ncbi:MAG TPA: cytochrome c oxidase subunit II [Acidimicrobiales bacterium]